MKVLIVSDTHGRHAGIEEAIQREFPFQRLIHLGDAEGYEDYIADLAECPIDIVSGNNDFFSDLPDEKIVFIDKKNADLWTRFLKAYRRHRVRFVWVKGHADIPENERCDRLAVAAASLPNLPPDTGYRPET